MSLIIGVLLDVSGSMKDSIGYGADVKGGTWAHSIFRVADDLVYYDVSESNRVFVIGFGAKYYPHTFDVISTIKEVLNAEANVIPLLYQKTSASISTIEDIFKILEQNGAHTIRQWAQTKTVSSAISEYKAKLILQKLNTDSHFTCNFVNEYLPKACRNWGENLAASYVQKVATGFVTIFKQASVEDIQKVIASALPEHAECQKDANAFLKRVSDQSVYNVKEVSNVLHGRLESKDLSSERVHKLLQLIEPYIYGATPLHSALKKAEELYKNIGLMYERHQKLLFVLSDGEPTDKGDLSSMKLQLQRQNVTIVTCYISKSYEVEPRKLHSVSQHHWEKGAKILFNLSSFVPASLVTRAIFIKYNWKIDINNNETRLFMQVNHPENLKDVCKLARNAVCCQDSLSELLVSVSFDLYINNKNRSAKVYDQGSDSTCYAHASATVLNLAMYRIVGRDSGYPTFEVLRDEMIRRHGIHGAKLFKSFKNYVLSIVCVVKKLTSMVH